jgi:hypothetical protein
MIQDGLAAGGEGVGMDRTRAAPGDPRGAVAPRLAMGRRRRGPYDMCNQVRGFSCAW